MSKDTQVKVTFTVAREGDGTVQINFTIPKELIEITRTKVATELGQNMEVPGFRKGKAPLEKVLPKIPENTLIEEIVKSLIPKSLGEAITQNNLKPAVYPKLEVLKAGDEDWEIRATTAEIPEIELGEYKKAVQGALRTGTIWTPEKGQPEKPKEPTKEEKEQVVVKVLLETVKLNVPSVLVEEEVNARLSNLLQRIEKLGLSLESYLASAGKTPQDLRNDYTFQAKEAIALDLILEKIAITENIKIDTKQIDDLISASAADPSLSEKLNTPEQRRIIEGILRRRTALESLSSLL